MVLVQHSLASRGNGFFFSPSSRLLPKRGHQNMLRHRLHCLGMPLQVPSYPAKGQDQ